VKYTDDFGAKEAVVSNAIGPVFTDLPAVRAPVLNPVPAKGWFTFVDIGEARAFDAGTGPLTASNDSNGQFRPGVTEVTWRATDSAGNVGTTTQLVKVIPLVEVSKDQRSAEGDSVAFKVILNGDALEYPVRVPYDVSGTADSDDHTLVSGEVLIDEPAAGELPEASVGFIIKTDADATEGVETIVITLNIPTNAVLGPYTTHTVEIVEGNVAPLVSLKASQLGVGHVLQVDPVGGEVTVQAVASDANGDALVYSWRGTDNAVVDRDGDTEDSQFVFDPVLLEPGQYYTFHVSVSDERADSVAVESSLMLKVLSEAPQESREDSDGDGVVNYLDTITASHVLQQKTAVPDQFLMQTEPGLKLSLGEIAFKADQGRSLVTQTEITEIAGDNAADTISNVGGYFDFTVSGLPIAGQSVQVVIPQLEQMPRSSVYRKLTSSGWQDFVEDENNSVKSAAANEEGYCPPPGHAAYQPGLKEGDWCLQLTIQDGGPNDSDGVANNSVTDPGGLGLILSDVSVISSGGTGAWHPLLAVLSIYIVLLFRNNNIYGSNRY
jgi:hypothetical protein